MYHTPKFATPTKKKKQDVPQNKAKPQVQTLHPKKSEETKKPAQKKHTGKPNTSNLAKSAKSKKTLTNPVVKKNEKKKNSYRKPAATRNVAKKSTSDSDDDDLEVNYMSSINESRGKKDIFVDLTTGYRKTSTPTDPKPLDGVRRSPRNIASKSSCNEKPLFKSAAKKELKYKVNPKPTTASTSTGSLPTNNQSFEELPSIETDCRPIPGHELPDFEDVGSRVARLESLISTMELERRNTNEKFLQSEVNLSAQRERVLSTLERMVSDRATILESVKYSLQNQTQLVNAVKYSLQNQSHLVNAVANLTYIVEGVRKSREESTQTVIPPPVLPKLENETQTDERVPQDLVHTEIQETQTDDIVHQDLVDTETQETQTDDVVREDLVKTQTQETQTQTHGVVPKDLVNTEKEETQTADRVPEELVKTDKQTDPCTQLDTSPQKNDSLVSLSDNAHITIPVPAVRYHQVNLDQDNGAVDLSLGVPSPDTANKLIKQIVAATMQQVPVDLTKATAASHVVSQQHLTEVLPADTVFKMVVIAEVHMDQTSADTDVPKQNLTQDMPPDTGEKVHINIVSDVDLTQPTAPGIQDLQVHHTSATSAGDQDLPVVNTADIVHDGKDPCKKKSNKSVPEDTKGKLEEADIIPAPKREKKDKKRKRVNEVVAISSDEQEQLKKGRVTRQRKGTKK